MTFPPPSPRVDEGQDVLVEPISVTAIRVLTATRSVSWETTDWNVWVADQRLAVHTNREDAVASAVAIARVANRPAWVRNDGNHPWESIDLS